MNRTHTIKFHTLLKAEIRRLLRYPTALLVIFVTLASPAAGLRLYRIIPSASSTSYSTTLNSAFLGNPALAGTLVGSIGFALLTAVTLSRDSRTRTDSIISTLLAPYHSILSRVAALLSLALLTQGITMLLWLPFTYIQIGVHFRLDWYLEFYLVLMLPAILCAILFTASVYQIFRQLELTLISFAAVSLLSLTVWYENWLLRWVNPPVYTLSDDFGNYRLLLSLCYNRMFLFLLTGGLFAFSFLCARRYQKNWLHSIPYNLKSWQYPLIGTLLLFTACLCYIRQPFLDHSGAPTDLLDTSSEELLDSISYRSISAEITPHVTTGCLSGKATYSIQNNSLDEQKLLLNSNPGYSIDSVLWDGEAISFSDLQNDTRNMKTIEITIPGDLRADLTIIWSGLPQEWDILSTMLGRLEISRDYIYLKGTDFLPVPENFTPSSSSSVDIKLTLPSDMTPVLFNSTASVEKLEERGRQTVWKIKNRTAYINLYAGNYIAQKIDADGTLIDFYYSSTQKELMEEYHAEETLKQVFSYCTKHYGPLQFENNGGMRLIEIASIGGGYAGMGTSVMGEDSFYRQSFEDSLKGNGGNEVLAHEIIHQWWGLGNMFEPEFDSDAWSSEGLTVYSTYRLMKELYGTDYALENYVAVWEREVTDYYQNFYVRHPEYLSLLPQHYQDELAMTYSRICQYCEMPLKILKAEKLVGGEEAMDEILSGLFQRDIDPSYPFLTYDDFLNACNLTREDLNIENTNFIEPNLY